MNQIIVFFFQFHEIFFFIMTIAHAILFMTYFLGFQLVLQLLIIFLCNFILILNFPNLFIWFFYKLITLWILSLKLLFEMLNFFLLSYFFCPKLFFFVGKNLYFILLLIINCLESKNLILKLAHLNVWSVFYDTVVETKRLIRSPFLEVFKKGPDIFTFFENLS